MLVWLPELLSKLQGILLLQYKAIITEVFHAGTLSGISVRKLHHAEPARELWTPAVSPLTHLVTPVMPDLLWCGRMLNIARLMVQGQAIAMILFLLLTPCQQTCCLMRKANPHMSDTPCSVQASRLHTWIGRQFYREGILQSCVFYMCGLSTAAQQINLLSLVEGNQ